MNRIAAGIYCLLSALLSIFIAGRFNDHDGILQSMALMISTCLLSIILFYIIERSFFKFFMGLMVAMLAITLTAPIYEGLSHIKQLETALDTYSLSFIGFSYFLLIYAVALYRIKAHNRRRKRKGSSPSLE